MLQVNVKKGFPPGRDSAGFTLEINFTAAAGVTVLFGPSGAGKTLTLDSIAGFIRPENGRILLENQILFDAEARVCLPPRMRRCGYVFQNYALFPHMTMRRNLEFAARGSRGLDKHKKIKEMLERFHLSEVAGRRPHELSGGQKQRGSIARALLGGQRNGGARVLLLDEPARGLDVPLRRELYGVLRQVRGEFGIPLLLVTHDLEECFELGDEMLVLREGKIVQTGAPSKVLAQPANLDVARLLGLQNLLPVEIRALDPSRNSSRLRYQEFDLNGPYFPGRLIGDRVWIHVPPASLNAIPRESRPGVNQVPASLTSVIEKPDGLLLQFNGDLAVHLPRAGFEPHRGVREWLIEFPPASLRIL